MEKMSENHKFYANPIKTGLSINSTFKRLYKEQQKIMNSFVNSGLYSNLLDELRTKIHSMPRNPSIIKFFRYAKLSENAGYGIDKMIKWEQLTGGKVEFDTTLVSSTITYWFGKRLSEQGSDQANNTDIQQNNGNGATEREQAGEQAREQVQKLVNVIREDIVTFPEILKRLGLSGKRNALMNYLKPAIEQGYVLRAFPDKPNHPKQRYYLSEEGLKLVK